MTLAKLQVQCDTLSHVKSTNYQIKKPPEQLIIKFFDGSTMLVFKTGKFRIMGGKWINDLDAHFNIFRVTLLCDDIPIIKLQTMTAVIQLPHKVNLALLADNVESYYNAESFPAVHVETYKPLNVNVFASGKVVIMGLKQESIVQNIEADLTALLYKLL